MRTMFRLIAGVVGLVSGVCGTVTAIYAFYSLKNGSADTGAWLVGTVGAVVAVIGAWIMLRAPRL